MQKILVIDDDGSVRHLVQRALRDQGFELFSAEDGLAGADMARTHLPDLILCDVKMDRLDGYGTLRLLRQDSATSAIPFILMTGQADHAGMRQGMELGADDYLPKPFSVSELLAAVQARLKKQVIFREQADKRLASLRANISCALPHEMRTPLNGIIGFSEIIMSDHRTLEPEELGAMAKAINDSAKRLHRVIENTLLYAQMELAAGDEAKIRALRQGRTLDVAPVVEKVARQRAEAAGRAGDLRLALLPVGVASADEYLARVVDELLDNAFKFSAAGTPVSIQVQTHTAVVAIAVRDAGRGLKPEHIAEIGAYMQFERRFYEQQGSGLGLTIAKRLVELHGGTLTVKSEGGAGTEVTVTLPALSSVPT